MSDETLFAFGALSLKIESAWALSPFVGRHAHIWMKSHSQSPTRTMLRGRAGKTHFPFDSVCGLHYVAIDKAPLLAHGNFPRCATCRDRAHRFKDRLHNINALEAMSGVDAG